MNRIIYTGIAAAMLFAGSMFTSANAMPVAPTNAVAITQALELPVVQAQFYFGAPPRRAYRPYYRGYRPVYRAQPRYYAPRRFNNGRNWGSRGPVYRDFRY